MTSFSMERRVYRRSRGPRSAHDADKPGDAEQVEEQDDPRVHAEADDLLGWTHDQADGVDGGHDDPDPAEPRRTGRDGRQDRLACEDVGQQEQGLLYLVAAEDVAHRQPDAAQAHSADARGDLGERGDGGKDRRTDTTPLMPHASASVVPDR